MPPRVVDERYELELTAVQPQIVTPIGMAFDRQGRLLVVESHTHQRPDGYEGSSSDRIRILADSDGDGKLDRWSTFAEGFRHAMNVLAREDGAVYVVTRRSVVLLRDRNHDGVADERTELIRLESEDDYPHNGLSGIAQAADDGTLVLGLGENHGMAYRLIGSDGKVIADGGGQDGFFCCTADGANLQWLARGVWNPFSICILPDGRTFAVDNDPDASPPCRLLHVVAGGDYGYLYQYGRAGTHPLQAWNGELPGTLPMVCGTGEAPTAIVAHAGRLWVTSWGDHRIERYRLLPRGKSYGAEREIIVQGDADFRPTGMAAAPDGSLYFGDWVLRDYQVHRKGRIWRLVLSESERKASFSPRSPDDRSSIEDAPSDSSIPVGTDDRLRALMALRWKATNDVEAILRNALREGSPNVRLFAVRWIADDRITTLRDEVAELLNAPQPNPRYYLAVLAAIDWLDNEPSLRGAGISDELLVRELQNEQRSAETKALTLRLLSPEHRFLSIDRLRGFLGSEHELMRLEAIRSLAGQSNGNRFALLAEVARDKSQGPDIRAEAIMGLAAVADEYRELIEQLTMSNEQILRNEAQRTLRLAGLRQTPLEAKPPVDDLGAWTELLQKPGDSAAGRRLFFSSVGPRCGVCHQHGGRGGRIGPDLTSISTSNEREQIIASILLPSREVAPHYQPWTLITSDGKTHTGLRLPKAGDDGIERYVDSSGAEFSLPSDSVEIRKTADTSIMPDGLESVVSIDDLRDLVTFLTSPEAE